MADFAIVAVGGALAYLAYKQIMTKGKELDEFQAGLFQEGDVAPLKTNKQERKSKYTSEAPDPSLDHFVGKLKHGKKNKPKRVTKDTKPALF